MISFKTLKKAIPSTCEVNVDGQTDSNRNIFFALLSNPHQPGKFLAYETLNSNFNTSILGLIGLNNLAHFFSGSKLDC